MNLVRGSEVQDFLRCRKRWSYRWQEHLKAKRPNGKLFTGNLLHKFLEADYSNGCHGSAGFEAMQKLFTETDTSRMEQVELDELWDVAVKVSENYVKQWGHIDQKWKVIATELTFAIPLDDPKDPECLYYSGTIDLVFLDEDGKLWFSDHKTTSSIERYVKNTEMDRQISRYWWALQQLARGNGLVWNQKYEKWDSINMIRLWDDLQEPAGFIYNILLKEYPEPPRLLKPTKDEPIKLSTAKDQKTTFNMYVKALLDNGLITEDAILPEWVPGSPPILSTNLVPEKYWEILDHLAAQETEAGNRYFRRVKVYRNQHEANAAIEEFYWTARDADAIRKHGIESRSIYRNINHDCSWDCEFKALCMAEMDGSNAVMIRNLAYEIDETKLEGEDD